jgi:hypothetical protein
MRSEKERATVRALVVYESMFGNTQEIARSIGEGLSSHMDVDVVEVGDAPATVDGIDLLVVGGPTHAFSMSKPATRLSAAEQATRPLVSTSGGIREWLAALEGGPKATATTTFDTRVDRPRLPGSAAQAAAKRLRRLGFGVAAQAMSFYVSKENRLIDGEIERARQWGAGLGSSLSATGISGRRAS